MLGVLKLSAGQPSGSGFESITAIRDLVNVQIGDENSPSIDASTIQVNGDFVSGTVALRTLTEKFYVGGDFSGTFKLSANPNGSGTPALRVFIGGDFLSGGVIRVPAYDAGDHSGGLNFRVTIGGASPYDGQWLGSIKLGEPGSDTTLSHDATVVGQYSAKHSTTGKGSVGVVSFGIHGSESTLRFLEDVSGGGAQTRSVSESEITAPNSEMVKPFTTFREYVGGDAAWFGRIAPLSTQSTLPALESYLLMQRRAYPAEEDGPDDGWQDITAVINPHFDFPASDTRISRFGGRDGNGAFTDYNATSIQFLNGYQYRFKTNRAASGDAALRTLRCTLDPDAQPGASASPLPADDQLLVRVGNICPSDINGDCVTDTADLTQLLLYYGQTSTRGIFGDLNSDDSVNTADLTILLSKFGQTCDCPSLMSGPHAGPQPAGHGITRAPAGVNTAHHNDASDENGAPSAGNQSSAATPAGPILTAMGFSTPEQYQAFVDTLTLEQQVEHIQFVLVLARALGY